MRLPVVHAGLGPLETRGAGGRLSPPAAWPGCWPLARSHSPERLGRSDHGARAEKIGPRRELSTISRSRSGSSFGSAAHTTLEPCSQARPLIERMQPHGKRTLPEISGSAFTLPASSSTVRSPGSRGRTGCADHRRSRTAAVAAARTSCLLAAADSGPSSPRPRTEADRRGRP